MWGSMGIKIFTQLLSLVLLFSCFSHLNAQAMMEVHDSQGNINLIKQIQSLREQVNQLEKQTREVQRLSSMIQNPQASAQSFMYDVRAPINSDIYRLQGLKNDMQRIINPSKNMGYGPRLSLNSLQNTTRFINDNLMVVNGPESKTYTVQDQLKVAEKKQAITREAVAKGAAISWQQKDRISEDFNSLEKMASKIDESPDLRSDMKLNNKLIVEQTRHLIHLRMINASVLENLSMMMMGGGE